MLGIGIALIPFMLARYDVIAYNSAVASSTALILAMLFALGLFLSTISKEHAVVSGIKMVVVGVLTAVLSFAFGGV